MTGSALPPGANAQLAALAGPFAPYAAELHLATREPIDVDGVLRALEGASGEVDVALLPDGAVVLEYLDHRTNFKDEKQVPMRHLISYLAEGGDRAAREAALQQTWDWPDPSALGGDARAGARAAMDRARAVLYVADSPGLQREERLAIFQRLVRALVTRLPVLAIHWVASQRIVDPAKYLSPDPTGPLHQGPINVRFFNVQNGPPGAKVMDTLGLTAFGLRDLQVQFRDLPEDGVAAWLYAAARLVFARGDFMTDRDTADGIGGVWRCHHEASGVGPAREVVDFRPDKAARAATPASMTGIRCPRCAWAPEILSRWECDCGFMWNTFDTRGICPVCERRHGETVCLRCRQSTAHGDWYR